MQCSIENHTMTATVTAGPPNIAEETLNIPQTKATMIVRSCVGLEMRVEHEGGQDGHRRRPGGVTVESRYYEH